jgi:hypothetical protein
MGAVGVRELKNRLTYDLRRGLQAAVNEPVTFVAADRRLLRAAAGERLATVDPEAGRRG